MKTTRTTRHFALTATALALATHSVGATEVDEGTPISQVEHEVSLVAIGDTDVQGGAPTANYGDHPVLHVGDTNKTVYLQFDLSEIPKNAKITRAQLITTVVGAGNGKNEVKLGVVQNAWKESRITYANQPNTKWTARKKTITAAGPLRWRIMPIVSAWVSGEAPNFGVAIRSTDRGPIWAFLSREGAPEDSRPMLHVNYTTFGGISGRLQDTVSQVPEAPRKREE